MKQSLVQHHSPWGGDVHPSILTPTGSLVLWANLNGTWQDRRFVQPLLSQTDMWNISRGYEKLFRWSVRFAAVKIPIKSKPSEIWWRKRLTATRRRAVPLSCGGLTCLLPAPAALPPANTIQLWCLLSWPSSYEVCPGWQLEVRGWISESDISLSSHITGGTSVGSGDQRHILHCS